MKHRTIVILPVLSLLLAACGASPKESRSPATAGDRMENEEASDHSTKKDGFPPQASQQTMTAQGQSAGATDDGPPGVSDARRSARRERDQAQRELDVSAADCSSACRALASLERATSRLCELVLSPPDEQECTSQKSTVTRARERVRATCGTCPGGRPSLEPGAPLSR